MTSSVDCMYVYIIITNKPPGITIYTKLSGESSADWLLTFEFSSSFDCVEVCWYLNGKQIQTVLRRVTTEPDLFRPVSTCLFSTQEFALILTSNSVTSRIKELISRMINPKKVW